MLTVSQANNPSFAVPQPSVVSVPGSGLASALEMLLALALVLALIFALAWLLRRLRTAPAGRQNLLRSEAELLVGEKERVIVLAMGDRRWLLGVTAASFTVLQQYDVEPAGKDSQDPGDARGATPAAVSFAALLRSSLGLGK